MNRKQLSTKDSEKSAAKPKFIKSKPTKEAGKYNSGNLNLLKDIEFDNNLKVVLQKIDGEVVVKIGSDGVNVSVMNTRGDKLCSLEQLQSLMRFRKFIIEEDKKDTSSKKLEPALVALYNLYKSNHNIFNPDGKTPAAVEAQVFGAVKPLVTAYKVLRENFLHIHLTPDTPIRTYLLATMARCLKIVIREITDCYKNSKDVPLRDILINESVPRWFYDKFTTRQIDGGVPLYRCLWGKNPSDSITVTMRELRSEAFRSFNSFIFGSASMFIQIFTNDVFLATQIDGFNPDLTTPVMQSFLGGRVTLPPIFESKDMFYGPKSEGKLLTPLDEHGSSAGSIITRIAFNLLKVYHIEVKTYDNSIVNEFFRIAPDRTRSDKNTFHYLNEKVDAEDKLKDWLQGITFDSVLKKHLLFMIEMRITAPASQIWRALYLRAEEGQTVRAIVTTPNIALTVEQTANNTAALESARNYDVLEEISEANKFDFNEKKSRALSAVTKEKPSKPGGSNKISILDKRAHRLMERFRTNDQVILHSTAILQWVMALPDRLHYHAMELALSQLETIDYAGQASEDESSDDDEPED